jgi:riboflavin transporter FmnP
MPKALWWYVAGLVALSAIALTTTSLVFPPSSQIGLAVSDIAAVNILAGIAFWTVIALVASALPVRMPGGILVTVSTAPIVAATVLGGPAAGGWVALIGSTEMREIRGRIPWYGTLANHAGIVLPATACGLVISWVASTVPGLAGELLGTMAGTATYFALNLVLVSILLSLRTGTSVENALTGDLGGFGVSLVALGPMAWLMTRIYSIDGGWWSTLIFGLPLYTTRFSYDQFVRIREMFTQTIEALAGAVDKRDPYTADHSRWVQEISVAIGREMRCSAKEIEALQWGGLLHDVGKIGVPDAILLKTSKLTREERAMMNAHPVLGAEIIAKVERLGPEMPVIRHHHEWYNGSGYPDRLIGDEIPKLARILHVADAFEAMTADRPYRKGLALDLALRELTNFAGVQFDPQVVDAFLRTKYARRSRFEPVDEPEAPIALLSELAARQARNAPAPGSPADLRA